MEFNINFATNYDITRPNTQVEPQMTENILVSIGELPGGIALYSLPAGSTVYDAFMRVNTSLPGQIISGKKVARKNTIECSLDDVLVDGDIVQAAKFIEGN